MRLSEADILIVPGLGAIGPDHWQRRWGTRFSTGHFVVPESGDRRTLEPWVETIRHDIMMATRPVVLVAHSLGVSAVVHAAAGLHDAKVRGAFLVAPPDHEGKTLPDHAAPFGHVPRDPLPFPSMLIASTSDPYCSVERAADLAACWASDFHLAGPAGHFDTASGHGPWPEGLVMFTRLMQRLR